MTGRKVWAADEILAAADLQSYIQDQVVFVYSNATTRAAGILSPTEGMVSYLQDTDLLYTFNGSTWVEVAPNVGTAGTYTKVTTDAKGRVSSGTTLSASDIPNLDSAKITTGSFDQSRITGTWDKGVYTTTGGGTFFGGINAGSGGIYATGVLSVDGVITLADVYNRSNTGRAVYVSSSGVMGIGSSSARFKENIVDADIDIDAVLQIAVRAFNYRKVFSEDTSTQIGVIAEELVELGLEQFVFFGDDGEPDGVAYDRLALALIPLIKLQAEKMDLFEARLQKLESK